MGMRRELKQARDSGELVRVVRCKGWSSVEGYVAAVGKRWFVVVSVADSLYDGTRCSASTTSAGCDPVDLALDLGRPVQHRLDVGHVVDIGVHGAPARIEPLTYRTTIGFTRVRD